MSQRIVPNVAEHCPFLNRADERCSEHFRLDKLGHAYRHCFDQYKLCPVYLDRLIERRVRRHDSVSTPSHAPALIQITLPPRHTHTPADHSGVPALSGV